MQILDTPESPNLYESENWFMKNEKIENIFNTPPPFSALSLLSPEGMMIDQEQNYELIRNKNIFMPLANPPVMPSLEHFQIQDLSPETLNIPENSPTEEFINLFDGIEEIQETKPLPRFHKTLFKQNHSPEFLQIQEQFIPNLEFKQEDQFSISQVKTEIIDPAYCESPPNVVPSMEETILPDLTAFESIEEFGNKISWNTELCQKLNFDLESETGRDYADNSECSSDSLLKTVKRKPTARSGKSARRGRRPRGLSEVGEDDENNESQQSAEAMCREYGVKIETNEDGSDDDDSQGMLIKLRFLPNYKLLV